MILPIMERLLRKPRIDGPEAADTIEQLYHALRAARPYVYEAREPDPSCTGSGPPGFDPERDNVTLALDHLTDDQRTFLLHGKPTTEWQTATASEWDGPLSCRLYIGDYWSPMWLGAEDAHYKGDGGPWHLTYRYTDFGLAVRAAIAMEAREGGDGATRLRAKHDSAVRSNRPNPVEEQ